MKKRLEELCIDFLQMSGRSVSCYGGCSFHTPDRLMEDHFVSIKWG